MHRMIVKAIAVCLVAIAASQALADSPVTSTPFSQAYLDYPAVKAAKRFGVMTPELAAYLATASVPVDVKAAVVNALSWDIEGKQNLPLYCQMRYRCAPTELGCRELAGDELLVLGYLMLMDDYSNPDRALPLLERAKSKLPKSYTVAMVHALAFSQKCLLTNKPGIWKSVEKVLGDGSLNGDMRIGAMRIIVDYMSLYSEGARQ